MDVVLRKIGNSVGVIIPKDVLDSLGVKVGDTLELRREASSLVLVPQDADFAEQLKAARMGMEKYRTAMRKLST
ncbi:AbrB/MazE/SpoVT family DNA-binding domain-containing protein [Rhizobium sp. SG2393]|uniref:AbrB/MazE/SpoVT family DNA-binding domain-containing protein n=1 Tax=Rhizobium sp. SG2393 TaxID=3276279 RepID=UPI003671C592